ncbi:DUF2637 domain-containing protein [Spongiactinospora sp. 9N601]|uniref:DUF2637 domain-containing protein n=1 Tax=Spongiactinospora sp. 9N601 TaxID=3375149 RepID=UPI0037A33A99
MRSRALTQSTPDTAQAEVSVPADRPSRDYIATTSRSANIIRRTTIATVVVLAAIAAIVSYQHMHQLAIQHGESFWSAALVPLAVDGMIVAASLALLEDSRAGRRGGLLPWLFLIISSGASLAANVAIAEPTFTARIIAAWPSLALIGAYEMLMRMIRHTARQQPPTRTAPYPQPVDKPESSHDGHAASGRHLQREAWQWATSVQQTNGHLPSATAIAAAYGRSARWGRLVKAAGQSGGLDY